MAKPGLGVYIPRALRAECGELSQVPDRAVEGRRDIVNWVAMGWQNYVGLLVSQKHQGEHGRRDAFGSAIRPLGRRDRPYLSRSVDKVAGKRARLAVDLSEVGNRSRRMPRSGERHDPQLTERLGTVIRHDAGYRDVREDREPVLPQVVGGC
jgi:hypothetical protein